MICKLCILHGGRVQVCMLAVGDDAVVLSAVADGWITLGRAGNHVDGREVVQEPIPMRSGDVR